MSATTARAGYTDASTQRVTAGNAIEYAYRDLGEGDVPLVLLELAGLLRDARVKIYPDSAHGFLFQHYAEFAADVHAFLGEPS